MYLHVGMLQVCPQINDFELKLPYQFLLDFGLIVKSMNFGLLLLIPSPR
jgi:hypothetical protein